MAVMNMTGSSGTRCHQSASQLDAGHSAQMNIHDKAGRLGCWSTGEEGLGRSKGLHIKALGAEQTFNRFEHGRVVINHR